MSVGSLTLTNDEKKYIEKFSIVGGGGVRPKYGKFHTFFFLFFLKASLSPYYLHNEKVII